MPVTKKQNPWRKRLLAAGLIIILAISGVYWYYATAQYADTKRIKSHYELTAMDLLREFGENDSLANQKYTEKIITVSGMISELESPDSATVNVKFIDSTTGHYAIFAFQDQHAAEAGNLREGEQVSIKGSCSGGTYSELLGVYSVEFKRSTLDK